MPLEINNDDFRSNIKPYHVSSIDTVAVQLSAEEILERVNRIVRENAAKICDRFQERYMSPAECAGAIRMMPDIKLEDILNHE
jgi:hypothetical protein